MFVHFRCRFVQIVMWPSVRTTRPTVNIYFGIAVWSRAPCRFCCLLPKGCWSFVDGVQSKFRIETYRTHNRGRQCWCKFNSWRCIRCCSCVAECVFEHMRSRHQSLISLMLNMCATFFISRISTALGRCTTSREPQLFVPRHVRQLVGSTCGLPT